MLNGLIEAQNPHALVLLEVSRYHAVLRRAPGYDALIQALMSSGSYRSPVDLIAAVGERDQDAAKNLTRQLETFRPRLIVNQTRTIRLPVHIAEIVNSYMRASRQLTQKLGRDPSIEEIAKKMGIPVMNTYPAIPLS